jgi:hypothetical protein
MDQQLLDPEEGVLGYKKVINIFLFPTVHDMILIDSLDS